MGLKSAVAKSFFDFAYAIAYRPVPASSKKPFLKGEDAPFRLLKPTLNLWYADPILGKVGNREYLFMEVFDRKKHKGMIGVSEFDSKGTLSSPRIILEEDFHLSFPIVFTYNNRTILMPECSDSKELRFYTLDEQSLTPTLFRKIPVKERLVDTVVLDINDSALTLLSCAEDQSNPKKTSLVLLKLDSLENAELQRLPLPEEYEASSFLLRNGGPVIHSGNTKIRILQESTETEYGHNLILRTVLNDGTVGEYAEEDLCKIFLEDLPVSLPRNYRKQGTHTYCLGEGFEVLDVSFNRFHPGNLGKK